MPTDLIAGGSGVLGQALAGRLEATHFDPVVAGRAIGRLQDAKGALHLQIKGLCMTSEAARALIEKSAPAGRRLNGFAHSVGNVRLGALHRLRDADFADCLLANLSSALHTMKGPACSAGAYSLIDSDVPPCKR